VQGVLGDGDAAGCEMPEAGEVGLAGSRVGELAPAEREVPEGGREALQGGRLHRRLGRRRGAVADVELLEAIEGWGPEPGVEAGEREVGDGEAAGGAPVRGEDAGDGVSSASSAPPQVARLSGAESQSGRHRAESACVHAPSLVGRSEMMSPRTSSGRRLIRSGPGQHHVTTSYHEATVDKGCPLYLLCLTLLYLFMDKPDLLAARS